MIQHIKNCIETEARRVSKTIISTGQFYDFITILYTRGTYQTKSLKASYLWSKKRNPPFFSDTMPRNKFLSIFIFIRLYKKTQRSEHLHIDRFILIFET